MKRTISSLALSAVFAGGLFADTIVLDGPITEDAVWTSDNEYHLDTYIFVKNNSTLTIEPGTVIRGDKDNASALIITRGSKIYSLGAPSAPVVFTAEEDPMDGTWTEEDFGKWGGLIVLGNATLNSNTAGTGSAPFEEGIEGIPTFVGDDRLYGGNDDDDNSGIIRYTSIRFGGDELEEGKEINGLTLGGVGRQTLIEYVEVFANKDDGVEFFGGTVNVRNAAVAFSSDDSFDYDMGWIGKGQNWFTIGTVVTNESENGDNGGEHDGEENSQGLHLGGGTIWNATYIGTGNNALRGGGALRIRDNGFAKYYNSIFTDYKDWGLRIEDSSASLVGTGDIDITNNIWWGFGNAIDGDLNTAAGVMHGTNEAAVFDAANENLVVDPMLMGISRVGGGNGGLDPRPSAGSPALSTANLKTVPSDDPFLSRQDFAGAFAPGSNWLNGWSYLSEGGYIPVSNANSENRAAALATRVSLEDDPSTVVAMGLVVAGTSPRMYVIRAMGAKNADFFVANPASATEFTIFDQASGDYIKDENGDTKVWTAWVDSPEKAAIEAMTSYVGLAPLTPTTTPDRPTNDTTSAVALVSLQAGAYSIEVTNPDGTGGEALLQIVDADF